MPREIPRVGHKDHDLGDVEDLIKAGCDRIKRLDELLRNKIREEKKIKERGRTLRKLIQFDLMNFIKPGLIGGEKTVEDTPTDPLSAEIFKNLAILQNSATGNPNLPRIEALKNMEQFLALCDAQEEAEGKLACRRFSDTVHDDNGFENIFPTECAQCSQDESDEELNARLAENEAIFSRSKIWTPVEEKEEEVNFPDDDKEPSHIHDSQAKDFIRRNIELARKANQLMPQTDAEKARLEDLLAEDDYFTDTELLESVSSDMVNNSDDSLALLRGHSLATTGKFNVDQSSNSSSGSSANQWILWPYFDGQPTDALSESEPSVKSISQLSPNEFESVEPKECHRYSQTEEARTMFGRLSEIDKQLELLTQTREEYNHSAGSNGCSTTSSDEIVDSSKSPSPVRTRLGGPGEKVLEQAMQTRRQIHRLNEIDTQLAVIQKEDFEQLLPDIQQTIVRFSITPKKAAESQLTRAQHPGSFDQAAMFSLPKPKLSLDEEQADMKQGNKPRLKARDVFRGAPAYRILCRSSPDHFILLRASRLRRPFTTESFSVRQTTQNGDRIRFPRISSSAAVTRDNTPLY